MRINKLLIKLLLMVFLVGCGSPDVSTNNDVSDNQDFDILKDNTITYTYIIPSGHSILNEGDNWYYYDEVYFFFDDKDEAYSFNEKYQLESEIAFCESNESEELYYTTKDMKIALLINSYRVVKKAFSE